VCVGDPDGHVVCRCQGELWDCSKYPEKCEENQPPTTATAPPVSPMPQGGGTYRCETSSAGPLLGAASAFNVFVLGDLDKSGSDTEGRMAVGGNAKLAGYSVGTALTNSNGARDDLIVGGNLTFNGGTVPNGNAAYGVSASLSGVSFPNGSARQAKPLNFAGAGAELKQTSAKLAAMAPNGSTFTAFSQVQLKGSAAQVNVFKVDGAALSSASSLSVAAPAGSTVIVNVGGADVQMSSVGYSISGTDRQRVLFNFHQATTLHFEGVGLEGSVLAPHAKVEFSNGNINGVLAAGSLSGPGENHEHPFDGCAPAL
jgi:choice-of-anchor A domain-containing protein